jgi:hypothetical protein
MNKHMTIVTSKVKLSHATSIAVKCNPIHPQCLIGIPPLNLLKSQVLADLCS